MNKKMHWGVLVTLAGVAWSGIVASSPTLSPHDGSTLSEQELYRLETQVLGQRHANEHAEVRAESQQIKKVLTASPLEKMEQFLSRLLGKADGDTNGIDYLINKLMHPAYAATGAPDQVGQWSAPFSMPVMGIHAVLLPTGKVLFFSYRPPKTTSAGLAYLWNPADGTGRTVNPPNNIWCGGQALLADGRVLIVGGNLAYANSTSYVKGLNQVYTFNPFNETWTRQPDLRHGRWYPTVTTLPDGRAVISNGLTEYGNRTINYEIEVFTPSPNLNGVGTLQYVGNRAMGGLYPHQFLMPNGRVLMAGPLRGDSAMLNPTDWSWSDIADLKQNHNGYGAGVLMPGGPEGPNKVMLIGGVAAGLATATTEVYDAANPAAGWQYLAPLSQGRHNNNTVILPDGTLLNIGGNNSIEQYANPHFEPELYNPQTNTWSPMAPHTQPRTYHSTAVLLPDGRVISAGDDGAPVGSTRYINDAVEIFSPPYLFRGPRPTITSVPNEIVWGQSFTIGALGNITKAVLMAPGATTHANDMHQRYVPLVISPATNGFIAVAPRSGNAAPPGYYMLFLISDKGVPSIARWVRLGASTLQFSIPNYSVSEGVGAATVKVTRLGTKKGAVTVDYATSDSTAIANSDYTPSTGAITFADGDAVPKTFTVPITDDTAIEPTETVNLTLSNPTGGAMLGSPNISALKITNNDIYLQFKAAGYNVDEAGGSVLITVTRAGTSPGAFSVDYTTSDGTATAGADYTSTTGTLSWAPGDYAAKTFSVAILDDAEVEPTETINLALSNPTGGAMVGTPSTAVVNIGNND